jgi:hypothetical protein
MLSSVAIPNYVFVTIVEVLLDQPPYLSLMELLTI